MQNGSLDAILVLRYDTLGFTMKAESTLDGYGRWKSNPGTWPYCTLQDP